jgi:IPT/TIG domain-containing protein
LAGLGGADGMSRAAGERRFGRGSGYGGAGNARGCRACDLELCLGCGAGTCTLAQTGLSSGLVATPAPGRITAWWAFSSNPGSTATLRVFHRVQPVFQQRYEAVGTSNSEALQSTVIAFPADLPADANDVLGLTFPTGSSVDAAANASSNVELFSDDFPDGTAEVATNQFADTLEFGARFIFEPVVSGIAASSGATAGGETVVVITGDHLTDSTKVMFGAAPAMSFSIDSNSRITATTPPESAGAVDVTVAGPAGTSATSVADQYTFGTPAATVSPTSLAFGDQPVGNSSAVLAVTLTNTGDVPVTVDADTLGGQMRRTSRSPPTDAPGMPSQQEDRARLT